MENAIILQLNQKYQILTHDLWKKNASQFCPQSCKQRYYSSNSITNTQILVFHTLTNHLPIFLGEVPAQIFPSFYWVVFFMMELKDFFMYSEYEFIIRYMFHAYFLPFSGCIIYFLKQLLIMMKFNSYFSSFIVIALLCLVPKNSA